MIWNEDGSLFEHLRDEAIDRSWEDLDCRDMEYDDYDDDQYDYYDPDQYDFDEL